MIVHPSSRFEGFSPDSWNALLELGLRFFEPEGKIEGEGDTPGYIVVLTDVTPTKALIWHSIHGACPSIPFPLERTLGELCDMHGVKRGLCLQRNAWQELLARASVRIHRESDIVFQALSLTRIVRELIDDGLVELWPDSKGWRRVPPPATVSSLVERSLPETCAVVAVAWRHKKIETAVIARRLRGSFDLVAGPERLLRWTGPLGGAWRRDYRIILRAVSEHVAPVHVGLFAETKTFETLLSSRHVGAFSQSLAVRELVLQPMPPTLAIMAGADAAAALTKNAARIIKESEVAHRLGPMGKALREKMKQFSLGRTPGSKFRLFDKR